MLSLFDIHLGVLNAIALAPRLVDALLLEQVPRVSLELALRPLALDQSELVGTHPLLDVDLPVDELTGLLCLHGPVLVLFQIEPLELRLLDTVDVAEIVLLVLLELEQGVQVDVVVAFAIV